MHHVCVFRGRHPTCGWKFQRWRNTTQHCRPGCSCAGAGRPSVMVWKACLHACTEYTPETAEAVGCLERIRVHRAIRLFILG
jgi:hypothetical protein